MTLALITSPVSFSGLAFAQEESVGISDTLEIELVHADEDEVELDGTITNLAFDVPLTNGTFTLNGGDPIVFNNNTVFDGLVISELVDGLEVQLILLVQMQILKMKLG